MIFININNPYEIMNKYSDVDLEPMTVEELISVQRSILFPYEQEIFDRDEPLFINDSREAFIDYTDRLITNKSL